MRDVECQASLLSVRRTPCNGCGDAECGFGTRLRLGGADLTASLSGSCFWRSPAMVGDALMVGSRRGGVARKFLALWKHGTPHASLVALAQVAGHCPLVAQAFSEDSCAL